MKTTPALQDLGLQANRGADDFGLSALGLAVLFCMACAGMASSRSLLAQHAQHQQVQDAGGKRTLRSDPKPTARSLISAGRSNLGLGGSAASQHFKQEEQQQQLTLITQRQADRLGQSGGLQAPPWVKPCRGPWRRELVPRLVPVGSWRSVKGDGGHGVGQGITLVTQLSLERLEMLQMQCDIWPDPIAAAVYVPTVGGLVQLQQNSSMSVASVEEAAGMLQAFHQLMEEQGSCQLHLELSTQDFEDQEAAGLYPFNAARNRALMLAETEVLLLLDADFLPSPSLAEGVRPQESYAKLLQRLRDGPSVIVVPAFQTVGSRTEGKQVAMSTAKGGKPAALEAYRRGTIIPSSPNFSKGHGPTDYQQWVSGDSMYPIHNQPGYEPYILITRQLAPWFDERFLGYGWDKISYFLQLGGLGVKFWGHPLAFAVHIPHRKAPTFESTKLSGHREKLLALFKEVNNRSRRGAYVPVVANSSVMCSWGGQRHR